VDVPQPLVFPRTDCSNELRLVPQGPHDVYASEACRNLPWAHCGSAHGARDNGPILTYLVSEAMYFSPHYFSEPTVAMSSDFSGPPRCIRVEAYASLPWARTVAQPMGRDNGSPYYPPSEAPAPVFRTDRSNELHQFLPPHRRMAEACAEAYRGRASVAQPMGEIMVYSYLVRRHKILCLCIFTRTGL
jgi:hypothetical protein